MSSFLVSSSLISMNEYTKPKSNSIPEQITILAFVSMVSFKGTGLVTSVTCFRVLANSS